MAGKCKHRGGKWRWTGVQSNAACVCAELRACDARSHAAQLRLERGQRRSVPMSIISRFHEPRTRWILRGAGALIAIYIIGVVALMWWWSYEPDQFDVAAFAQRRAAAHQQQVVTGSVVTSTLMDCAETLLDNRGGYISNDKFPPGLFMDNVPNWEFGVLTATRDLAREMRNK